MQERFRMFCRAGGNFYARDKITGRSESLGTADRTAAKQLLAARNQAAAQPQLNRTMAKAYLSAKSPDLLTRTWADVMEHYSITGVESTRKRKATAFRSRPFALLRGVTLMDTEAAHLLAVLEHERTGNSTHHYLRRLHNYALHLGWLLMPVMADAAWPEVRRRKFAAITLEEHCRIVERELMLERKLYYEMLWETGGSQSDITALHWNQIDLGNETIRFVRRKLEGKESGGESLLRIGPCIRKLLNQLPQSGYLFPRLSMWSSDSRSSEFCRRCRMLGITGKSLHSYRYAWAQRARAAGMPEREAMNHLGHESRAVHAAYAGGAQVACRDSCAFCFPTAPSFAFKGRLGFKTLSPHATMKNDGEQWRMMARSSACPKFIRGGVSFFLCPDYFRFSSVELASALILTSELFAIVANVFLT